MATVTPPPPPPPPTPPQGPSAPTVTVNNPPASLMAATLGSKFDGLVTIQDGSGVLQVRTPVGTLAVQTVLPIPQGSTLALTLQTLLPQAQLLITAIDGKAPHIALRAAGGGARPAGTAPGGTGPAPAATPGAAAGAPSATPLTPGAVVSGVLLRPAPTGPITPTATAGTLAVPGTPAGTPAAGAAAPTGAAATTAAAGPAATASGQAAAGPAAATVRAATLPAGTQLSLRVVDVRLPNQPPSPTPAPAPGAGVAAGQVIQGTVSGTTTAGQPIVTTPNATLALATATPLPTGARVVLDVAASPSPPPQSAPALGPREGLFLSREWPALREAVEALQQADPAVARHLVNSIIPRADAQLAANILFFLSALRGGDVGTWLGDGALRALQRLRPEVAGRLQDDFRQLARMSDEPVSGDWRAALIPFAGGGDVQQVRLLLRRNRDEDEGDGGDSGTRFVVDLELSRLGRLQLDGLARQRGRRLDLIVRSAEPLPGRMRDDIRGIFRDAVALTGMDGGVTFQARPPNFVEVTPGGDDADRVGVIV